MSHVRNEKRKVTQVAQRRKLQTAAQVGLGAWIQCDNMHQHETMAPSHNLPDSPG